MIQLQFENMEKKTENGMLGYYSENQIEEKFPNIQTEKYELI